MDWNELQTEISITLQEWINLHKITYYMNELITKNLLDGWEWIKLIDLYYL